MSIFSKIFGGSSNAVATVPGTQNQGAEDTWHGIKITDSLDVSWLTVRVGNAFASRNSDWYNDWKKYSEDSIRIGDFVHSPTSNPLESGEIDRAENLWKLLIEQSKDKSARDVRESGVGKIDWVKVSFTLRFLDFDAIRQMVDYQRDQAIFAAVKASEERALFRFRQTSKTPLLAGGNTHQKKPVVLVESFIGERYKEFFDNIGALLEKLTRDAEFSDGVLNNRFTPKKLAGIDNLQIKKTPLPAELLYRLKREVVLQRLDSGPRARLLQVERALQDEIARNMTKITSHNGADEARNTVKTAYIWMSIGEDTIKGTVMEGKFKDRSLHSMTGDELREFYQECKEDETSQALLEAYFKHIDFENFRQKKDWQRTASNAGGDMDLQTACEILGLDVPESGEIIPKSKIQGAFRRKARENHPDTTGEDTQTAHENMAQINEAKEALLHHYGYK